MEFDGLIPVKEEPYYGYSEEISGFSEQTLDGDVKLETLDGESECEIVDDDGTFKRFKLVPYFDECSDVVGQSSWMKEELVWAEECGETSDLKIDGVVSLDADDSGTSNPVLPPYDVESEQVEEAPSVEGQELYIISEKNVASQAKNVVSRAKNVGFKQLYACTLCEFECARLSTIKRHSLNHRKQMKFTCTICSFGCNMESRMDLHMMTRHKYVCESCGIRFKKLSLLKQHLRDSHSTYSCEICGQRYTEKVLLEAHSKKCEEKRDKKARSEGKFVCEECGHKADSKGLLRSHQRSHPADKPFACDLCSYRARTAHLLKVHTRVHTKPYVCGACKSRFSHPKLLQMHQQKCRGGTKTVELECNTCDYRTKFVAQLKIHLMHHSAGDYGCDICEMKFTSVRRLHDHKQTHSSDLEPLACKFCDYRCSMVDTLIAHSGTHKENATASQ